MFSKLTESQKSFILSYSPKDRMFTSSEEVEKIVEVFNLELMDFEMNRNYRDAVVYFYDDLLKRETIYDENGEYKGRTDKHDFYMLGLQSITAVFDYV